MLLSMALQTSNGAICFVDGVDTGLRAGSEHRTYPRSRR